jgi:pimeloyl-ACP methyl ester carboxylesterase
VEDFATVTVGVEDGHIEVVVEGAGEPVLLIQTALLAEELRPLCWQPAFAGFRRIRMHRRGYAGSSAVTDVRPVTAEAADCVALLDTLDITQAHIVGLSFSSAIAMQLASDAPGRVRTLSLLEAPPVHVPSSAAFRAANDELAAHRAAHGAAAALDPFLGRLLGPEWRAEVERLVPGGVAQMTRDAATFFDSDTPALLSWTFGQAEARRYRGPVLYVGGSASGRWFDEVRDLIRDWFPHTETHAIEGADHNLALTHPADIAPVLADFLTRHPPHG